MALCASKIRVALHNDAETVTNIVRETIKTSDRWALNKISDAGTGNAHDDDTTIIYGEAVQPFKEYEQKNYSLQDLTSGQEMVGAGCTGQAISFEVNANPMRDNACSGEVILEYGQGYRTLGFTDHEIRPKTNVLCATELAGRSRAHIKAFFDGFMRNFAEWGYNNFNANLQNFVVRDGGANATVLSEGYFDVTSGTFHAPPVNRMSIWFLEQYRRYMKRAGALSDNEYLEIEMDKQDWADAVRAHQLFLGGPNAVINVDVHKDDTADSNLKGREFAVYGMIKAYFTDEPIKGFFKKTGYSGGKETFTFVRVYPWVNEEGETGGLVARPNHDYDKPFIYCEGVKYDMCILALHIHPKSFSRKGLEAEYRPGSAMAPTSYVVQIIDGAHLAGTPCGNDYNEKFKLVARHRFRWRKHYPEWSGAIAYRASERAAYVIPPVADEYPVPTNSPASASVFDGQGVLPCQVSACQDCGYDTALPGGACADNPTDDTLRLSPYGALLTTYLGTTHQVKIRVTRSGNGSGAASVGYTITDTPGAGLATTPEHYVDVSDTPGTVSWADGDLADKEIVLNIVGASGNTTDLACTIQLTGPTNAAIDANCDEAVLSINDGRY